MLTQEPRQELRKARIESAKRDLVREGLRELVYQREDLPDEVREITPRAIYS